MRLAALGYYAGQPELIRKDVLDRLPQLVAPLFRPTSGFVLLREPPCPLPTYLFLAELLSARPIRPEFHFSDLVVGWFADSLPTNLDSYIAEQVHAVDWDRYACDGEW
jgi:hypothetical protein